MQIPYWHALRPPWRPATALSSLRHHTIGMYWAKSARHGPHHRHRRSSFAQTNQAATAPPRTACHIFPELSSTVPSRAPQSPRGEAVGKTLARAIMPARPIPPEAREKPLPISRGRCPLEHSIPGHITRRITCRGPLPSSFSSWQAQIPARNFLSGVCCRPSSSSHTPCVSTPCRNHPSGICSLVPCLRTLPFVPPLVHLAPPSCAASRRSNPAAERSRASGRDLQMHRAAHAQHFVSVSAGAARMANRACVHAVYACVGKGPDRSHPFSGGRCAVDIMCKGRESVAIDVGSPWVAAIRGLQASLKYAFIDASGMGPCSAPEGLLPGGCVWIRGCYAQKEGGALLLNLLSGS